ncbi:MAG TPA: hypothetical protein VF540_02530 [Segetibacter sp.]
MSSYKYIVFCIIFLVLIPCKIIFSQDIFSYEIESDTAVQSELDIKYDSALAKATSSLTASAFQQSIDYYKEASALKPGETYPYKMIRYVKELEIQKKRSDDLKRKAQIRDDLIRANQAIVDKSWNKAKSLFNEILTLHPEKTDEDYAKSKIEAIDLELKRIALRTPVVVAPPVVIPPRNRREARAQRKLAERSAIIASAANRVKAQKQTEAVKTPTAPLSTAKNGNKSNAAAPKRVPQPSTKGSLPDTMARGMPLNKDISESPGELKFLDIIPGAIPPTNEISKPPAEASLPNTKVAVDSPLAKEISQPPTEASLPDRNVVVNTPSAKEILQKPTEALLPGRKVAVDTPSPAEVLQKPTEALLPARKVAVSTPPTTEISLAPAPLAEKKMDNLMPPFEETEEKSTGVPLLNLADSSNNVKLTCQDISFIGTNAYIKVLIQNYRDSVSFLTDTLQVSIKKNNGTVKKLDQRFISNFPVVMPQKELVLVYFADASIAVDPDDIFILQMEDKLKQTKLMIQVPWSMYKQHKSF